MARLDRLVTMNVAFPAAKIAGPKAGTRVPILMYHSISENLFGKSHPYYQINTAPQIFVEQMRSLRRMGYRTLTPGEIVEGFQRGADLAKAFVITFDDGYRDFVKEALPVLKECGFTATIYLATSRIQDAPATFDGAEYLTWGEVRELRKEGMEFGSHTISHPILRDQKPDEVRNELKRSKEIIEDKLGVPVGSFAYPYAFPEEDAAFKKFLDAELQSAGYHNGVTTILGRASREDHRFFLPRLPINSWDDERFLKAKLEGGYDWLHWPQRLKKTLRHKLKSGKRKKDTDIWN
jgi:peptidoglycan/xylan/chitin deacetylase (PgdA/CDA1 family)